MGTSDLGRCIEPDGRDVVSSGSRHLDFHCVEKHVVLLSGFLGHAKVHEFAG